MSARTGNTYTTPKGVVTRSQSGKAKSYTGKGPAPAGSKKVAEKSYSEVPTVTVASDGSVSTSRYGRKSAAGRAVRSQKRHAKRIRRVVALSKPKAQKLPKAPKVYVAPKSKRTPSNSKSGSYDFNPQTAVITSTPNPRAKPPTFKGLKTAGEPSRRELQKAAKAGTLRTNKKGFATTPRIRKVGEELRRLRSKARSSNAPLPGLDSEGTQVARKVLKTGRKMGANRKELLAAAETGLVESSGFHNLHSGDADSEGWRQERVSLFGSDAVHPKKGAQNFFDEAKAQSGATAGELAANVQRPAEQYRGRYDEVKPEAAAVLKAFKKGGLKPRQQKRLRVVSKEAQRLGLKSTGATSAGPAPKPVVTRFKAAKVAMKEVEGTPYVWGGGHNSGKVNPTGGLDCSGAVSYVLQHIGVELPGGVTSGDMGSYLKPGPGLLTVYYNAGHTFLKLGDEYWGTSVGDSGAGGLGPHDAPSQPYLSQYSVAHVPGMGRKQLLQMGFKAGGSFASPGITYSQGGTVATVDSSTAATVPGKPGFSKKPISPLQKYRQTKKALHNLGVGESSTTTSHSSGSVLSKLERKYGVAA